MALMQAAWCVIYLIIRQLYIDLEIDLLSSEIFEYSFLAISIYMMISHISYAITQHQVITKSIMIDWGNRLMDIFTHAVYSIIFVTDIASKQQYQHLFPNVSNAMHLFLCIWHIMKHGEDSFSMRLRKNESVNKLDGFAHLFTFSQLYLRFLDNTDPIYLIICHMICALIIIIYVPMRKANLIW